ncbi:MAG: SDR family oxidoreductase [Gammaproteobacteria bacterium]|nr:SDR family oxidoreductase [Gammaproteobacteria bacterium]
MSSILVTGASGLFGGEIARQLVETGIPIRILVRDSTRAPVLEGSVETVIGDYRDTASLTAAMQGIDKLFLASFDQPNIVELQANVLKVARRCGVQHVVRLSSDGTEEDKDLPIFQWHGECERQLEASGLDFTHLKPMWIMQNFESFVVNDCIRLPAADGRIGLVDHRDVASMGVAALITPGHEGKAHIMVTESLSHADVAKQLSEATGRSIAYIDIAPEVYQQELQAAEWDKPSIDSMLGLFSAVRAGTNSDTDVTDTVEALLGRPGIRFRQYAEDFAANFGSTV